LQTRGLAESFEGIDSSSAAMSNPRAACSPVKGFMRPRLGFSCSENIVHTDNQFLFWQSWIRHFWCRLSSVPL